MDNLTRTLLLYTDLRLVRQFTFRTVERHHYSLLTSLQCVLYTAKQLPAFLRTVSEAAFHLLWTWFLLLATCLSQWANEMAASLSRARLPSMDKQLQQHTVQMPCLTVPATPWERTTEEIMTNLYMICTRSTWDHTCVGNCRNTLICSTVKHHTGQLQSI